MATNPMIPADAAAAPAQDTDQPAADPGYLICIAVDGAGKISVGVESQAEEAAEGEEYTGEPDGQGEGDYTPVGSMQEALSMAQAIYRNKGQMPDMNPDMAAAKAGYAKMSKGRPQMEAPNPGGVFGE